MSHSVDETVEDWKPVVLVAPKPGVRVFTKPAGKLQRSKVATAPLATECIAHNSPERINVSVELDDEVSLGVGDFFQTRPFPTKACGRPRARGFVSVFMHASASALILSNQPDGEPVECMAPEEVERIVAYYKAIDAFVLDVEEVDVGPGAELIDASQSQTASQSPMDESAVQLATEQSFVETDAHEDEEEEVRESGPLELPQMSPFISALPQMSPFISALPTPVRREALELPQMSPFLPPAMAALVEEKAQPEETEAPVVAKPAPAKKKVVGRKAKKSAQQQQQQHLKTTKQPADARENSRADLNQSSVFMNVAEFDKLMRGAEADTAMRMSVYDANFGTGRSSSILIADHCEEQDVLAAFGLGEQ